MGNYPDEERYRVWNTDAYTELVNYLTNTKEKNILTKLKIVSC